jgi:hypothetical protein
VSENSFLWALRTSLCDSAFRVGEMLDPLGLGIPARRNSLLVATELARAKRALNEDAMRARREMIRAIGQGVASHESGNSLQG